MPPELVTVFDQIDSALRDRAHLLFEGGTDADVVACICRAASARGWQVSTPRADSELLYYDRHHIFLIRNPRQLSWVPKWLSRDAGSGYIGFAIHATPQFPASLYRARLSLNGNRRICRISLPAMHLESTLHHVV